MKDRIHFIITLICGICSFQSLYAQWCITSMPNQWQMPVGNVHLTFEDRRGYQWYATDGGGVCRDNGYQIDVIKRGLPSLQIRQLAEDTCGNIWVGTAAGLCRIDAQTLQVNPHLTPAATCAPFVTQPIQAVTATPRGDIWVASGNLLGRFNAHGQCLHIYVVKNPKNENSINSLYVDAQQRLWALLSRIGLMVLDTSTQQFKQCVWNGGDPIEMIDDPVNGGYWVGTWASGVVHYNENGQIIPVTPSFNCLDLCLDSTGTTLFTTDMNHLRQWDVNKGGKLTENTAVRRLVPSGRLILDKMQRDASGNIWVAAYTPHTFFLSPVDSSRMVTSIHQLSRCLLQEENMRLLPHNLIVEGDNIWFWQGRIGLFHYSTHEGLKKVKGIRPPEHLSRMEKCVHRRGVWLAQKSSLYCIAYDSRDGFSLEKIIDIPDGDCIYSICDAGNGKIWLGTNCSVLGYDLNKRAFFYKKATSDCVLFLQLDRQGNPHWILENKTLFTTLASSQDGTLWWGDNDGYIYIQTNTDTVPRKVYQAIPGETINRICVDRQGHVWSLSDQNVNEYHPQTQLGRTLNAAHPDLALDFFRSICIADNGVYVGGAGNVTQIASLEALNTPGEHKLPVVTTLLSDGELYVPSLREEVRVDARVKVLELRLSTLDIRYANYIRYAYRIKELQQNFTTLPIGENNVQLLLSSPGNYTFEVRATDNDGVWTPAYTLLTLQKLPYWWQTIWAYIGYAVLVLAILAFVLWRWMIAQQRKRNEKMQLQLADMKLKFFTNISHELRTPLTLIITPLENMVNKTGGADLKPILKQALHLLQLINSLLDFKKIDSGAMRLENKIGDVISFVHTEVEAFQSQALQQRIKLVVEAPEGTLYAEFDHSKLHHILENLLSNAIKYNHPDGSVIVSLTIQDNLFQIVVKDTGIGIPESQQAHIFDRFYQATNHPMNSGTGIGLNVAMEYAKLMGGNLSVTSREGEGSIFTLSCVMNVVSQSPVEVSAGKPNVKGSSLLIVEDHEEFRTFLFNELSAQGYKVLQAGNGMQALEVLNQYPDIDIIVSDVMMPLMDGIEMCKKLKGDVHTSHIPVILLTAQWGTSGMLEGYDAGADIYLTKPFSIAVLLNRIAHLMEQSKKRHHAFLHSVELKSDALAKNDIDRDFLNRAVALVEQHLDQTDYSVERFAADLHTERTNLYRKLQNLTGQNPSEFIRTIRLKKAAVLLQQDKMPVSDVAYQCGFSTPSYFATCFKKMFGLTPAEYQTNNKR